MTMQCAMTGLPIMSAAAAEAEDLPPSLGRVAMIFSDNTRLRGLDVSGSELQFTIGGSPIDAEQALESDVVRVVLDEFVDEHTSFYDLPANLELDAYDPAAVRSRYTEMRAAFVAATRPAATSLGV